MFSSVSTRLSSFLPKNMLLGKMAAINYSQDVNKPDLSGSRTSPDPALDLDTAYCGSRNETINNKQHIKDGSRPSRGHANSTPTGFFLKTGTRGVPGDVRSRWGSCFTALIRRLRL